jgi:hypothetical protein
MDRYGEAFFVFRDKAYRIKNQYFSATILGPPADEPVKNTTNAV